MRGRSQVRPSLRRSRFDSVICSLYVLAMTQGSFFPDPQPAVPDGEVVETLRMAIACAGPAAAVSGPPALQLVR